MCPVESGEHVEDFKPDDFQNGVSRENLGRVAQDTCNSAGERCWAPGHGDEEGQTGNHLMNSYHEFLKRCKEI